MDYKAIAEWATGRRTGASSTCIARHLMGLKSDGSYPHDGGDFGRCEALLDAVPTLRANFAAMSGVNKYWAALVPRWDEIKASPNRYELIQSIIRKIEDEDPNHIRLGAGVSIRPAASNKGPGGGAG